MLLGAAFIGTEAAAQSQPLRLPDRAASRGRATTRAKTPERPAPVPSRPVYPRHYPRRHAAFPVAVTYLPAVVMSDGSIWADFGGGFMPVRRACRVKAGKVIDGRGFSTERYRQPAPAQRSASANLLPHVQEQRRKEYEAAARNACFTRMRGGFVVVR